ncbi:GNAT family N-acetyltransferase, partial [Rhizobiaceae sp. 2RAB30]
MLGQSDVEACLRLSDEAGWNQTAEDWGLFLRHGTTIGVRSDDGSLVASAAALPYDRFGFVSMVLVTAAWRRRGLATGLVDRCVETLTSRGLVPVLDATPAG